MHVLEKSFLDLLRGNIGDVHDADIKIGNRYSPTDNTPCITIDCVDETYVRKHYITINQKQYLRKTFDVDIWINIYSNNEEDRQNIKEDVNNRIIQAETNHYTTCNHFNDDICSITKNTCEALTSQNTRACKNQCPDLNKYQSFFTTNHIRKSTFKTIGEAKMDDLDATQPILRTIVKLNMEYYTYHQIGGKTFNKIFMEDIA